MKAQTRSKTTARAGLVAWAIALAAATVGCAVPPSVDGAPCPCPSGFYCDSVRNLCAAGQAPGMTPTGNPTGSDPLPADPGSTPPVALPSPPTCSGIGAPRPARLTPTEYRFAVADLLGVTLTAAEVPPDQPVPETGFARPAEDVYTDEAMRALAKTVTARAVSGLKIPPGCATTPTDDACGGLFVDSFGLRAFRRPLEDADRAALMASFTAGRSKGTLLDGLAAVVEAALASDKFLQRRDVAADPAAKGPLVNVDPWSIASRLAALLWRSSPDDVLLEAANKGELSTATVIEKQATRMLQDPRALRMLVTFFREWLDVDEAALAQTQSTAPGDSAALRAKLLQSFDGFATLVHQQDVPLATLLTTPNVLGDQTLATFYNLVAPVGTGFESLAPRDAQIRRGLVTSPGFLVAHGSIEQTKPVKRGKAVLSRLLCVDLPPPPPNVAFLPPPPMNIPVTTRDRLIEHATNPACASCHQVLDPMGLGLENFDALGRWRTTEMGLAINAAGTLESMGGLPALTFDGPAQMAASMAQAAGVQTCYVHQWFRFAFARFETSADGCTLDAIDKALAAIQPAGQGRTSALLLAMIRSDAFTKISVAAGK